MPGLMIIAHAPLASSLKAVAQHTFPDCAHSLEALDVLPNMPIEEVVALARQMLGRVRSPEALIFTDVFGATPCNVAQRLADGVQICVVAGVNVPMLWRSLCYANEPLAVVVDRALVGAAQGVRLVAASIDDNQIIKTDTNDKNDAHHQQ